MKPYYTDDRVTLYHGDCLDVLTTLPDASVDSVVCDPPYGLANTDPAHVAETITRWANGERDYLPGGAGFMGKAWDAFVPPVAVWDECLRVLKPGGHVLAFAGSRTVDLMTLGLRLAGLEIRDSIAWLYGSGFPKSLDVSKAIDKVAPRAGMFAAFAAHFWEQWQASGMTRREFVPHFPHYKNAESVMAQLSNWKLAKNVPSHQDYAILRDLIGLSGEWQPLIERVEAERAVIRERTMSQGGGTSLQLRMGEAREVRADITAPATPDAERWQGWGTALKPAFEPVVVARKPLGGPVSIRSRVEYELRQRGVEGEIQWTTRPASGAASQSPMPTSGSTSQQPTAATSARNASASATQPTANATGSDTEKSTASGEPQTPTRSRPTAETPTGDSATPSSTPTAPTARAAAKPSRHSSRSTTSTAAAPSIESRYTERSTPNSAAKDSHPATESFAGIATGLSGSWATVRIDRLEDGTFVWPVGLPEMVTAGSTVAGNVLAHGTGALNIEACRVGDEVLPAQARNVTVMGTFQGAEGNVTAERVGRWPTNVVLDDSQAEVLDEQSGESSSRATRVSDERVQVESSSYGIGQGRRDPSNSHTDSGGASRFFPTFRYEAKAPTSERPKVNGTAHPTVKPLDLMRWLVRLVTPPGGTVLEPFAGSGTTVEAAIVEGFHCIAIEREADYLPLIMSRIHRRRDPVAALKLANEDLGLFEESA